MYRARWLFSSATEKGQPGVFELYKKREADQLILLGNRTCKISRNETPVRVKLSNGHVSPQSDLCVEAGTQDPNRDVRKRYAWRCRVLCLMGLSLSEKDVLIFKPLCTAIASVTRL
jgi:hypothetical protein